MKENWGIGWKDYYKILQVPPSTEPEIIKAAFAKLARKYHPDVNNEPTALNQMKDLNEAFEILNNPLKRAAYDVKYNQREESHTALIKGSYPDFKMKPNHPLTHDDNESIWCCKWSPCPRCVSGNMYIAYDSEYVCLQCGYHYYIDAIAKKLEI